MSGIIDRLQKAVINPLDRLAFRLRTPPPGDALLETTGRRSGQPRVTPVCDCLDGDTFWIIAQHGASSDYVRNIKANLAISMVMKAAFVALAVAGVATLWMAVVADTGASVVVIANALRLLRAD